MENNEHKTIKEKKNSFGQQQIAGAILIAGMLIAGAILLKGRMPTPNPSDPNKVNLKDIKLKPVSMTDEHVLGNKNAKVVIVEYSDTECPFSKRFHSTMQQVMEKYGDKIAYVYRHWPLDCVQSNGPDCRTLHAKARPEAEATECVWEQGGNEAFSKYLDNIFQTTGSNDALDSEKLPQMAQALGINMDQFNKCVTDRKYKDKVSDNVTSGTEAGVQGTPKSFILKNGKIVDTIDGAYPFEAVSQKLDAVLK